MGESNAARDDVFSNQNDLLSAGMKQTQAFDMAANDSVPIG